MNYSIRYLSEGGITERSEFLALDSDAEANSHAKLEMAQHFIVEVWKDENLLSRTFRDVPVN